MRIVCLLGIYAPKSIKEKQSGNLYENVFRECGKRNLQQSNKDNNFLDAHSVKY